jgi:hypothetical protein
MVDIDYFTSTTTRISAILSDTLGELLEARLVLVVVTLAIGFALIPQKYTCVLTGAVEHSGKGFPDGSIGGVP